MIKIPRFQEGKYLQNANFLHMLVVVFPLMFDQFSAQSVAVILVNCKFCMCFSPP